MRIEVVQGDITTLAVDAIVNAANETLLPGAGVSGTIHRAAGPGLLRECEALPEVAPGVRCPTGEARLTGGHRLHARYVIHTVGPVWAGGDQGEPELLARCYRNSLELALVHKIQSIAFPAISCGIYGYPQDRAAVVAIEQVRAWAEQHPRPQQVIFCCYDAGSAAQWRAALGAEQPAA